MNTPQQKSWKICLLGDAGIDLYTYGKVTRISQEAPVPIFDKVKSISKLGMASNVCSNLEHLGLDVTFFHTNVSVKERFIDTRSRQQLMRLDNDAIRTELDIQEIDFSTYDAIVISDYNKGTLGYSTIERIIRQNICPIFIDTKKKDLKRFAGAFVKINELEFNEAISLPPMSTLIVTRGADSVLFNNIEIQVPEVTETIDVCGAGDTFLSSLVYSYLCTRDMICAIKFASKASSITLKHIGTYSPTLEEIRMVDG